MRLGYLPVQRSQWRNRLRLYYFRLYYDAVVKTLYRRLYDDILLCYLSNSEAEEVIKEAHDGICGSHQPGLKLKDRLHWLGYYWPTMIADVAKYAKKCKVCQIHADFVHQPPEMLHPTIATWPFEAWGIDVIGPISPPSIRGHRFIVVVTDYFSNWTETVLLAEVKMINVISFIKHHVIHRFGIPWRIIYDNGPQFASQSFYQFYDKYRI